VQFSNFVLAKMEGRSAFCLLDTGVVGSNPTPGHGSLSAFVLYKYRSPDTPIPRAPIQTQFRNLGKGKSRTRLSCVATEGRSTCTCETAG
jgi:hypothetical protein